MVLCVAETNASTSGANGGGGGGELASVPFWW